MKRCAGCNKVLWLEPKFKNKGKLYCMGCFDEVAKKRYEEEKKKPSLSYLEKLEETKKELEKERGFWGYIGGIGLIIIAFIVGYNQGFVFVSLELIIGIILIVYTANKNSRIDLKLKEIDLEITREREKRKKK